MQHDLRNPPLARGFSFRDLYDQRGLERMQSDFSTFISERNPELHERYLARLSDDRINSTSSTLYAEQNDADLLINLAPLLEDYLVILFDIAAPVSQLRQASFDQAIIQKCRKFFIQKRISHLAEPAPLPSPDAARIRLQEIGISWPEMPSPQAAERSSSAAAVAAELAFAQQALSLNDADPDLPHFLRYATWAIHTPEGQRQHRHSQLFTLVQSKDYTNLVERQIPPEQLRNRSGFSLNDPGITLEKSSRNVHYCLFCHNRGKDSCAKGIPSTATSSTSPQFATNPLGVALHGCPLREKISEMNLLRSRHHGIGALAVAMIDNPMIAATGHRICNDCATACIYQKQEPVDVPLIETSILEETLHLPWGFEIYSLLTRWNPLHFAAPLPNIWLKHSNYDHTTAHLTEGGQTLKSTPKLLVVGMGPAGFTIAHHLLRRGMTVVAIDGCKIEPLPPGLTGIDHTDTTSLGSRHDFAPIVDVRGIFTPLEERIPEGFGGVMEYGITVRWNKNYLRLIRIILERHPNFRLYGSVRYGSTFTRDDATQFGFSHIVLAMGAGAPRLPEYGGEIIPGLLTKGVRMAADFLMNLQTTDLHHPESIANLQIELPILVLGAGLTAVDAATESLNYYAVQVEKFLARHESIVATQDKKLMHCNSDLSYLGNLSPADYQTARTFLDHGIALRQQRRHQSMLLQSWGGAQLVYRRQLIDSPAYRNNHHELAAAFAEGVGFVENITILSITKDKTARCRGLHCRNQHGTEFTLLGRTVLIASGTEANSFLQSEQNRFKPGKSFEIELAADNSGPGLSIIGDMHPQYSGSVVKAMASASAAAEEIYHTIGSSAPASSPDHPTASDQIDDACRSFVEKVTIINPGSNQDGTGGVVELVIRAPLAARAFRPGQFYRLQNYRNLQLQPQPEYTAAASRHQPCNIADIPMEPLALTGAEVDRERGTITFVILEMGGSSSICRHLKPGQPVALMGPTGAPSEIVTKQDVILIGGGVGNAVLLSIAAELRRRNCRIIYFAGYRKLSDRYKAAEIEKNADVVVWCCDEGIIPTSRPNDHSFHGNIIDGITAYAATIAAAEQSAAGGSYIPQSNSHRPEPVSKTKNSVPPTSINLQTVTSLFIVGSPGLMQAVAAARQLGGLLHEILPAQQHRAYASINSPMQCMLQRICGQCLQINRGPDGRISYIYSCAQQDQELDSVDFGCLQDRLTQNKLSEQQTAVWFEMQTQQRSDSGATG